jgi:hypothetical protein
MENETMKTIDTKSLQIFEDMKAGLYERGYDENDLIIDDEDPLLYEVEINSSSLVGVNNPHSTLWARYFPDYQHVFVGVTFPDRIPEEKMPFMMTLLNGMNSGFLSQHLTLCPVCHRIDAIAGISLAVRKLPREKFQILLSMSEANAIFLHSAIRQITDVGQSVDDLISIFCKDHPELEEYYGGRS